MQKKILLALVTAVFLLSIVLAGCSSGIPQVQYDQTAAQLKDTQSKLSEAQNNLSKLQAEKSTVDVQLKDAQSQIASLQGQVGGLKEQATLTGANPTETAAKIVKYYHETHVYSTYDLFICSDMSAEVWNMLKAQGIKAVVAVGSVHNTIADIVQSEHAWVLAEVAPGQYLALETTGGFTVPKSQNPLYYRGWSFDSPATLKSYNEMIREYNIRIVLHNNIVAEDKKVIDKHNKSTSQSEADKWEAVHNELVALIDQQETELNNLMAEIKKLAKTL